MDENNGNGHGPSEALEKELGPILDVKNLKREDGIITMSPQQMGVLRETFNALHKVDEYRQILMMAFFDNPKDADRAAGAIAWAKRYGVSIEPILDKIVARCAIKGKRVEDVYRALMRVEISSNNWKDKANANRSANSPLSR